MMPNPSYGAVSSGEVRSRVQRACRTTTVIMEGSPGSWGMRGQQRALSGIVASMEALTMAVEMAKGEQP